MRTYALVLLVTGAPCVIGSAADQQSPAVHQPASNEPNHPLHFGQGFGDLPEATAHRAENKKTPLASAAHEALGCAALYNMEFGFVPSLSSYAAWSVVQPKFKDFPIKLLKALKSAGSKDQKTALQFIAMYSAVIRTGAIEHGHADLEARVQRAVAPHGESIRAALVQSLADKNATNRLYAAVALLAFVPKHAKADALLTELIEEKDADFRQKMCETIGNMRLSNKDAIKTLVMGLEQKEPKVRRSAAIAAWKIGISAKATVPALITLQKSGNVARGNVHPAFRIAFGYETNVALLALSKMGAHAKPVLPILIRKLKMETAEKRCEVLKCLAGIGSPAKETVPAIRELLNSRELFSPATRELLLNSEKQPLRLAAACSLLSVIPEDKHAIVLMWKALTDQNKKTRESALKILLDFGPPAKGLAPTLIGMLEDENEDTRIYASHALGHMGTKAAEAIPALEKLLFKQVNGMDNTFLSPRAAGIALAKMGKAAVPALIRATKKNSGGRDAAIYWLGHLGDDAKPAVKPLMEILKEKDNEIRFPAVIALGHLGRHAQPARPALIAASRERAIAKPKTEIDAWTQLAIHWALGEIPK